jgi:hypothetical protein
MKIYCPSIDPLFDRKLALSMLQNIPDMGKYAQAWADLAAEFEMIGFWSNASYCKSRALHYAAVAAITPGEYVRLVDGSFSELIPVDGS